MGQTVLGRMAGGSWTGGHAANGSASIVTCPASCPRMTLLLHRSSLAHMLVCMQVLFNYCPLANLDPDYRWC